MFFLIVKSSSLGDILHTFPVVSYLRQKFPDAYIDWVVEKPFEDLLIHHPYIRKVITIDTKKWRRNKIHSFSEILAFRQEIQKIKYQAAFDLQGNMKSALVLSLVKAKDKVGFGRSSVAEWPNLFFTHIKKTPPPGLNIREDNLFLVQDYFGDPLKMMDEGIQLGTISSDIKNLISSHQGKKVMVCPGAYWPNKQLSLSKLSLFLENMSKVEKCHFFLIWGSDAEKQIAEELSHKIPSTIFPKLSLPVLQNAMSHMDLVIAMDSLPLHLAATTQTKTLSFFGPSLAKKYAPMGLRHQVIQGICPYQIKFEKRCPRLRSCQTGACIKNIDL